ncbi:pleiotropic drug resistance protein 3-like [Gossypium australe]|uniref:Pleiotropic drug resistance protein 3-like n=1 Tax=Gossypium australe TaxID=47621 RepID=A0A5B6X262_9ROSI|nr:pleiotropic drug resistance protein 3-like [Gossypium australe]
MAVVNIDNKVIEKVIITLSERYGSKISSLKDSRDLSIISLSKLINVLYAQELELFKLQGKERLEREEKEANERWWEEEYPPCSHYKKTTHLAIWRWCAKIKDNHSSNSSSNTMLRIRQLMRTKLKRSKCSLPLFLLQAKKSTRTG